MSGGNNGKVLTVSRKLAKILTVSRKSHHPIETLLGRPGVGSDWHFENPCRNKLFSDYLKFSVL